MYVCRNKNEISEFTLETVSPIIEKVENHLEEAESDIVGIVCIFCD